MTNQLVHLWLHEPFRPVVHAISHAIVGVQVWCYGKTMITHPGSPPAEWCDAALKGEVPVEVCPTTGVMHPPRARYVRRIGEVVLHCDHQCFWMAHPVGHRNRRYFILYLVWSTILCAWGALLSLLEARGAYGVPAWPSYEGAQGVLATLAFPPRYLYDLAYDRLDGEPLSRTAHRHTLLLLLLLDTGAAVQLGGMASFHLVAAAMGRTSLTSGDTTYDVGVGHNWRAVFGTRVLGWFLPVDGLPEGDGVHFERAGEKGASKAD